jgi:intracellular multiplication protein IcmE
MAGRKENLKALFTNTRSRVIILFTAVVLITAVVIGFIKISGSLNVKTPSVANLTQAPVGMRSIPGSIDPTAQYAALQTAQNVSQARRAIKTGGSSIPTIIGGQKFGEGIESVGPQKGQGAVGFETLAREDVEGNQQSLWIQSLKDGNCSKSSVDSIVQQGASMKVVKKACSCLQLKDDGYQLNSLQPVCNCKELKAAGYNARQMKEIGFTAGRLRECGFDACELRQAGYSAQEMKDGGYSDGELKGAGYSDGEIRRASGLPDGITDDDIRKSGCDALALSKLREAGVSAAAIRRINGCSAAQLKAAGYTAQDLKNAGFSAAELLKAGFTPDDLREAGYSARDLLNAGISPNALELAGFTPDEIKAAELELPPGVTPAEIKAAGCNVESLKRERLAGVSAALIHQYAGCSAAALKAAGFSDVSLVNAGFSPAQIKSAEDLGDEAIKAAGCEPKKLHELFLQGVSAKRIHDLNGCSAKALKDAGFSAKDLRDAGFSAKDLLNAGFTPKDLLAAGFTPAEIKAGEDEIDAAIKAAGCDPQKLHVLFLEGISAKRIHDLNGCSAKALKDAGFSAKDLLNAGFSPQDLLAAGFTPAEIKAAQAISDLAIKAAGCDPKKLHELFVQGVSAKQIHDLNGCSAQALKDAGFSAKDLLDAGFSPQDLLAAGFTPAQIKAALGTSDDEIKSAGCEPSKLHALFLQGVSAKRIHDLNGCSAKALKDAGFSANDLLDAGFSPQDLLAAGFSPPQIKAAEDASDAVIRDAGCDPTKLHELFLQGISAKRIHDLNGCSAATLKAAGFGANDLTAAGFTPADLLSAGFTPEQIKGSGLDDATIRAAGCDIQKLHDLFLQGVSARRIHDLNGCSAEALKEAGYNAQQLADAGFRPYELLKAGFTAQQLKDAGLSPVGVFAAGRTADCSVESLNAARTLGVTASEIRQTLGCSAKQLKDAGYTAAELKAAGFTAAELKDAGFDAAALKAAGFTAKELKAAGFSAAALKAAGFSAKELKDAGFSAADLKNVGFSAEELHKAGFSGKDLKAAGFTIAQLKNAGYTAGDLEDAGISAIDTTLAGLPGLNTPAKVSDIAPLPSIAAGLNDGQSNSAETQNTKQLQEILKRQQSQVADQRYQQKIQQRTALMMSAATQTLQNWKTTPAQSYTAGTPPTDKKSSVASVNGGGTIQGLGAQNSNAGMHGSNQAPTLIKAGDVLFAVLDTSVNSDEPGPILATIVSGKLNGAKLIGSFTLPSNADKMVINFNKMSVPGAQSTTSINAYAIDPNTARTALSSRADHHYLLRYGSLFAATFLEGFGNAFQSANTTITIGGPTGGTQNTTVQNGIGRSILENAVIGLATLGKNWGQVAQQQFSTPTTVDLFSGTGIGVLFTQDLASL